ncbi:MULTISPECIES: MepB family protein [Staphylococcus]|uniref:MepB family protein n=1 Tax=Staphylococcus TaxID=1279 RepID=UPI000852BE93|nr:MepB family protein [Staphylococcus equorum]MCM3071903.1 MepB family protein [Staphylococcus equorum]MDK9846202.1 MepB family protein [Staphylococcus equorum]MDK9849644.1 MepB family protein [Staphylococcus equorum]MDK9853909.1 MepB family protein [Staphylococcus equorum]OEK53824.1 MepB protein [Staphylococcus equorum]
MFEEYASKKLINKMDEMVNDFSPVNFEIEKWNREYEGFNFSLTHHTFKSRLAKKTPKKTGYFVAMWQKNEIAKNIPFNCENSKDYLIINIIDGARTGQFIFPKDILLANGIITSTKHKGKMAMRVYPHWESNLNKTALKTQKWQSPYFLDLSTTFNEKDICTYYEIK